MKKDIFIWKKIQNILLQCTVIEFCFLWLFGAAYFSNYKDRWDDTVLSYVNGHLIMHFIIMLAVIIALVISFAKEKSRYGTTELRTTLCKKSNLWVLALFFVHIIIRSFMNGSYQLSDGFTYFDRIRWILSYPNAMIDNFFENGKIAGGHIAQGYIFVMSLGQLLNTKNGMGFQYSMMLIGALSACCIYGIFRCIFIKEKEWKCAFAAFVVSVQPMFLGLSTLSQMEYTLAVLFIFAVWSYFYKKYILMLFSLLLLGTCKETGTMMAFSLSGMMILYYLIGIFRGKNDTEDAESSKHKKVKLVILVGIIVCLCVVFAMVLYLPLWNNNRIIDILTGKTGGNMQFAFDREHIIIKAAQLYILNFSWLWVGIILIGSIFLIIFKKRRDTVSIRYDKLIFIVVQYVVYTLFLLMFLEAKQPRYNILSDVLLIFFAMTVVIRIIDKSNVYICTMSVIGLLTFTEVFLTIDPVSRLVFTSVNTNGIPMVWTCTFKKDKAIMNSNIGEFGYYNYQYTFVDRALDKIFDKENYQGWYRVVSSYLEGTEDQLLCEWLLWDSELRQRVYRESDAGDNFHFVNRVNFVQETIYKDPRGILIESPLCDNDTKQAIRSLEELYDIRGPYISSVGLAGSVIYYMLYIK